MISIIVPIYNAEKCLRQCLDSIIRQTYTDWQLILVNDGSTDDSAHICNEYEQIDRRIMVLHQSNKGVSSARNKGIENAQGEFLCFVDADDWLEETFLADFRTDSVDADFYISGWFFNTNGKTYSCVKYHTIYCCSISEICNEFLKQNLRGNGYPWGKLFRASVIYENHLLFNEKVSFNEDHLFVLEFLVHINTLYIISSIGYQYRVFSGSNTKLSGKKHLYSEYIENAESFNKVLCNIKDKWDLPDKGFQNLYLHLVYHSRMHAMEALVLSREKVYFSYELKYWKNVRMYGRRESVFLSVVNSHIPQCAKWHILKLIYKIKFFYHKYRNSEKAIYQYISTNSTSILQ